MRGPRTGFSEVVLPNKIREAMKFLGMEMPEENVYKNIYGISMVEAETGRVFFSNEFGVSETTIAEF